MNQNLNILELFSGIGGSTQGFINSGYTFNQHYFSEVDKHAIANYQYNFKNATYIGPVQSVIGAAIKRPHIITFGSPCQDFSLAGKKQGLNGQRSSLIMEAITIINYYKPSVFIWENVKGAFSSNGGADFWAILAAFANIGGYRLEWQLLNTSWFLPQNRERIYLVGHLTGASEPGVFPITKNGRLFTEAENTNNGQSQTQHSSTISTKQGNRSTDTFIVPKNAHKLTAGGKSGGLHSDMTLIKQINPAQEFGNQPMQQNRVYDTTGLMATLSAHRTEGKVNILVPEVKAVLIPNRKEKRQNGRQFKNEGEPSFTVTSQDLDGVKINQTIRRLTEIECERLQGFADDFTKYGNYNGIIKTIAKTQRYKLIGNAVTTNVVAAIASKLNILK